MTFKVISRLVLSETPDIPIVVEPSIAFAFIVKPFTVSSSTSGTNIPVSKLDSVTRVSIAIPLTTSTTTDIVYKGFARTPCMASIV